MFLLEMRQTSKSIRTTTTSSDPSSDSQQRRTVAAVASSESITYNVVPRLLGLLAEQSCTSYRPGARPAIQPIAVPQRQRAVNSMLKVSKLVALMSRMNADKPHRQSGHRS